MQRNNFVYLLAGLLLLFVTGPAVMQFSMGALVLELAFAATLILSVWSFAADRKWVVFGLILAAASVISILADIYLEVAFLDFVSVGVLLVFFVFSTVIATRQVLFQGVIDANKIIGSISIYLLLGFVWAQAYLLLDAITPGSFSGVPGESLEMRWSNVVYYSFVTLTTLGYGDMAPATHIARALAALEAIFGQFYIAILVASLVAVYISERRQGRDR